MPSTTTHQPRTLSLFSQWIGIPLGLSIGAVNALLLQRPVRVFIGFPLDDVLSRFIVVFVSGIIAGAVQGAFLRPYTRPVMIWLIANGIGWTLAYGLMRYFYTTARSTILPTVDEVSLGLGMGLIVGVAQWIVLRHRLNAAYWWIISTVLC
jgi:hypothetical protein